MLVADDVYLLYCQYVPVVMFRNLTKASFPVDIESTSIEIYHEENSSLRAVKCPPLLLVRYRMYPAG